MLGLGSAFEKLSQNMPWNFSLSEGIRKRAIRFLLHRYLGQFLLESLSVDQFTVDISKGTGIIKDLVLDTRSLNEVAEQLNLPFKLITGYIGEILVNIPWRNLFSENCFVEISGLNLVLHPKQRDGDISLVDSMIDSMSTSMQIAQECLSQVTTAETEKEINFEAKSTTFEKAYEGESSSIDAIEHFAKAIDTILNKIKVRFTDCFVRLEYLPKLSFTGIALEIKVDKIDYFDEAGFEKDTTSYYSSPEKTYLQPDSFTSKKFLIEGVSLFTNEFSRKHSATQHDGKLFESQLNKSIELDNSEEEFHDTYNSSFIASVDDTVSNKDFIGSGVEPIIKESILVAKLGSQQEIKLKLRKNDIVSGPKVHFEANCGSLQTFISPRQLHLLIELSEGMLSPENIENNEIHDNKINGNCHQKPMNQNDFKKIEHELLNHMQIPNQIPSYSLNQQDGWSSPPDITNDDEFHPVSFGSLKMEGAAKKFMTSSNLTDMSDIEASYSSSVSSYDRGKGKKHVGNEISTNFKIRLNSFCLIILHEDVLIPSADPLEQVTVSSVTEMQKKSDTFFTSIGCSYSSDHCFGEYVELKNMLKEACTLSHLQFIGTSIVIDGNEKSLLNKWEMKTNVTAGWCEVTEALNDSDTESPRMIYNSLLTFNEKPNSVSNHMYTLLKPKIQVSISQSQNIQVTGKSRRTGTPKSEIKICLDDCMTEIDISLVDRINTLLNKQNIVCTSEEFIPPEKLPPSQLDNQAFFKEMMEDIISKPETKTNLSIQCQNISLKILFPVPDYRPLSDMDRAPWWKRNVRQEVLIIEAEDVFFQAELNSTCVNTFEILSSDIHFLFQEKKDLLRHSILRASGPKGIEKGFNPIRIYIQSFPSKTDCVFEDEPVFDHKNIMNKSMMGFLEQVDHNPNIFSKRQVVFQQENARSELTIPADREEIGKFINDTLKNIQFDIDVTLSDIQVILPSKHIYEVLYNRLASDLLLWVPSAPNCSNRNTASLPSMIGDLNIEDTVFPEFYHCGSEFKAFTAFKDRDKEDSETTYTSLYEPIHRSKKQDASKPTNGQTFLGLQVKIFNGTGAIHTPYKDSENQIIPGRYGNVSFTFEKGILFIASGYKGDSNCCYGCISVNTLNVYHKANNLSSLMASYLDPNFPLNLQKMDPVLYPCDTLCKIGGGNTPSIETKERLSVCFKMDLDMVKNEKGFNLAGGMFGLTMRHYMTTSSESWMCQLGDMFIVEDYPIEGYSFPDTIIELNFHFEHCGIDYRPLYLPLKSYVAIDSLAISSNLTAKGNSSVLLIIVEDSGIFLSNNFTSKSVNVKDNYVCIADLGVFELCVKIENDSTNCPTQEILFSNNIIHLRTCSDSFKAFMELIIYLANEGDLIKEPSDAKFKSKDDLTAIEPSFEEETLCFANNQNSLSCHDIVENMMQEAMLESTLPDKGLVKSKESEMDVDVFFFPDESKNVANKVKKEPFPKLRQKSHDLDTEFALREALEDECADNLLEETMPGTDDEFCVLDEIPGTGIKSPSGKPKAKYIKLEHVSVKDEHFDPTNNYSYEARLSTPRHFPKPHTKFNLQEISVIWHMYGGKDFNDETNPSDKNGNQKILKLKSPQSSPRLKKSATVTFANGDATIVSERASSSTTVSPSFLRSKLNSKWFALGGPGRCHDTLMEIQLNKVRFKYEMYPETSTLESRHILEVNDVEIRDRLASSKINKFLYQFSSECHPRQASSNMIQVKAITKRNDPTVNTSETCLNISVRPIRLNIDQDALIFLSKFVEEIMISDKESDYGEEEKPPSSLCHAPVMAVNYGHFSDFNGENSQPNLVPNEKSNCDAQKNLQGNHGSPVYFRNVIFSPDVPIRIDYHGKHIDINSQYGALAGLIIGLGQLDHSEITLKRVEFRSGVLGVNKLINSLVHEWIYDIKRNQLPSILGGIGPMHSFVKLFGGIKDLFWLPIEQYHKDGRVFRGIQRGTSAFTSSSAYAVLDLTGRFVACIQSTAETMYDIVSSGPSVKHKKYKSERGQAKDIREGVTAALGLVRNGLGDTASNIIKVAAEEHSHKGVSGAVGGVLRQIPPSFVQPIIIASEATCTVIGGITNQLVPDARKEAADKWKS